MDLNKWLAEEVMGWTLTETDEWRDNNDAGQVRYFKSNGMADEDGHYWQPTKNIEQAMLCAKEWQKESTCRMVVLEQYIDQPPAIVQVWACKLHDMDTNVSVNTNVS